MNATAPDVLAWLMTSLRALHPVRLFVVAVGVVLSGVVVAGLSALFSGNAPDLDSWLHQPFAEAREFWLLLTPNSLRSSYQRCGFTFLLLALLWAPVLAWVARHEIIARYSNPYESERPVFLSPTAIVRRSWGSLSKSVPIILFLTTLFLVPLLLAIVIGNLGSGGATLVAIALPIVLIGNLLAFFMVFGLLAWPLQPIAIVVECADIFDGLSRSYNYAFQRPLTFLLLLAVSLGIAALPVVGWHYLQALLAVGGMAGPGYWLAFAIGSSLFASTQTLIYLHLRALIDEVDQSTFVGNPDANDGTVIVETPTAPAPTTTRETPRYNSRPGLATALLLTLTMIVVWWLTYRLYEAGCSAETAWLGWGFHDGLVPPAPGWYKVASVVAGFWGFVWVVFPFLQFARPRRAPEEQIPPP